MEPPSICKCGDTMTSVCGRTQDKLDALLEKARVDGRTRRDTDTYGDYFESLTCTTKGTTKGKMIDHCKKCTKTIDMHAPSPSNDDVFALLDPCVYGSETNSGVKNIVQSLPCCVCGRGKPVTVAHILPGNTTASRLGLPNAAECRNFLPLCGTLAAKGKPNGTCHDAFDKYQLFFVHRDADTWNVYYDATYPFPHIPPACVNLQTLPHRTALHTRAKACIAFPGRNFIQTGSTYDKATIEEWIKIVTPPTSQTPSDELCKCDKCAQPKECFEDVLHGGMYCPGCWVEHGGCTLCGTRFNENDVSGASRHFTSQKHTSKKKAKEEASGVQTTLEDVPPPKKRKMN